MFKDVVDTYLNTINCCLSSLAGRQRRFHPKFPSRWSIESKNVKPRHKSSKLHLKSSQLPKHERSSYH